MIVFPGLGLRIHGAENVKGNVIKWGEETRQLISETLEWSSQAALENMRTEMYEAYDYGHKTADSLDVDIIDDGDDISADIMILDYGHLKYMTNAIPEGDFRPGGREILPVNGNKLVFYWEKVGGWVSLPRVWHRFTTDRDVILEEGQNALALMARAVEDAARSAVAEINTRGGSSNFSGRVRRGSGKIRQT